MEGNECYKFTTVKHYLRLTNGGPVKLALEIGANVGDVTAQLLEHFPEASIVAFEPVPEYFEKARNRYRHHANVVVRCAAVTTAHQFFDDLGLCPKPSSEPLRILKGLPAGGPGWVGGSQILPLGGANTMRSNPGYLYMPDDVAAVSLNQAVADALEVTQSNEIDFLKVDCEGCEFSCFGTASRETMKKIRFIGGEYHDIQRFYRVMHERLFETHYVNLVGMQNMGSFFAERIGEARTILEPSRVGMLQPRPWLGSEPIEWNVFREEFVAPEDRASCALA